MNDLIERIEYALANFDTFETKLILEQALAALKFARSMVVDVNEMRTGNTDEFGPFENGEHIEWPNLAILVDQLEEALQ